ncbi:MAG: SDR family oxidoreductase [Candidatus Schekmanbacteria bacterium]|nr:SDR family oxidoreductase [Candidatus Schekmanbacteria bacterium]
MRLRNKTALITGGGRGLGKAIALRFAEEGADIAICSRSLKELKEVAAEIEKLGRRVLLLKVDVSEERQVKKFIESAMKKFGQIDILINNAGKCSFVPVIEMSYDDWATIINTNLNSAFLFSKAVLPHMIKRRYGKIINISSIAGLKASALIAAYCASKAGLISLTQSLAAEVGSMGVYVNAVVPGSVETKMLEEVLSKGAVKMGMSDEEAFKNLLSNSTALRRLATALEVANAVLFLASEESSGITGETITVSAGQKFL